jgi:hypothetical protein
MKKIVISVLLVIVFSLAFSAVDLIIPTFSTPVMITTAGQSAGAAMMKVLFTKSTVKDFVFEKLVTAQQLDGYKTLVVVAGASSKGLGAAGIDLDNEISRVSELISAAKAKGIKIIVAQIEGTARRGVSSDNLFSLFVPLSDWVIIVKDADNDGFFSNLCSEKQIPLTIVDKSIEVSAQINKVFE